jgi:hypothetical protein
MKMKILELANLLSAAVKAKLQSRKGQNTVEYLLMLSVIVGIVLIVAAALKGWFPKIIGMIQGLISGAAEEVAGTD